MSYTSRIRTLEESYKLVEIQINNLENAEVVDQEKLQRLREAKSNYWNQLRDLRRAQYEDSQRVEFDDDR